MRLFPKRLIYKRKNMDIILKSLKKNILIKLTLSAAFTMLMVLSANIFVYLPFSPVPLTFQVLTVLLSSIILGGKWALFSQASYLFLGLAGLPVFSGFKNGIAALTGPTGGYIIGFLAASYITGYIYNSINNKNRASVFISCFAGLIFIYFFGYIHLTSYLVAGSGLSINIFTKSFKLAIMPFIIFDLIKIFLISNLVNLKLKK